MDKSVPLDMEGTPAAAVNNLRLVDLAKNVLQESAKDAPNPLRFDLSCRENNSYAA